MKKLVLTVMSLCLAVTMWGHIHQQAANGHPK